MAQERWLKRSQASFVRVHDSEGTLLSETERATRKSTHISGLQF